MELVAGLVGVLAGVLVVLLVMAISMAIGILTSYGIYLFYIALFVPLFSIPVIPFFTFYFVFFVIAICTEKASNVSAKEVWVSSVVKCLAVWVGYFIYITWR